MQKRISTLPFQGTKEQQEQLFKVIDENGRNVGVERMGAVERFYGLRCSVAVYRKRQYRGDRKSGAEIYAAWRCDRRRDHLDCN